MKSTLIPLAILAGSFTASADSSIIIGGGGSVQPFGEPDTATYGQTFTVGADNVLTDFSFWLDDEYADYPVSFAAYVYAWDGAKAAGPELYASSMVSTTNNGGSDGFEQFTFNTGELALTEGEKYIAFLSASNFFAFSDNGLAYMEASGTDSYAGGDFAYYNNGSTFAALTLGAWEYVGSDLYGDARFEANFTGGIGGAIPEPATWLMMIMGFGMTGLFVRRRLARA